MHMEFNLDVTWVLHSLWEQLHNALQGYVGISPKFETNNPDEMLQFTL